MGVSACVIVAGSAHGLLWGDLPYRDPARLVYLYEVYPGQSPGEGVPVSIPTFEDWQAYNSTLEGIARVPISESPSVLLLGNPERVQSYGISSDLLELLGVSPIMGRPFAPEEEAPGGNHKVLLLSHAYWNRRMEADPNAVGKRIPLGDGTYTVVGVMPQDFSYPPFTAGRYKADFWVPAISELKAYRSREERWQIVIGRLNPDATVPEARRNMQAVAARIGEENPATNAGWGVLLSPIQRRFIERSESREIFFLLGIAVISILILSCANVASLLSSRAVKRQTDMAVMIALGADKALLVRRMLAEGMVLALLSTAGSVLLAWAGFNFVERLIPAHVPQVGEISIQPAIVGLAVALGLLTSLSCSVLPVLGFGQPYHIDALRAAGRFPSRLEHRLGTLVILLQVTIATFLLALSVTAIMRLNRILANTGESISVGSVVTVELGSSTAFESDRPLRQFHEEALSRIRSLAGVDSAALVSELPLSPRRFRRAVSLTNRASNDTRANQEAIADARMIIVSPEYFRTMGVSLLRGRDFDTRDSAESKRVAIASQSLASNPRLEQRLGERIRMLGDEWLTIIGVAADAPLEFGRNEPILYVPATQIGSEDPNAFQEYLILAGDASLVIRTSLPVTAIASSVRNAIWSVNERQPVAVQSMTAVVATSSASERLIAFVFSCLACVGAILAGAGVYGVLANFTNRRTREIGLRKSLGARSSLVAWSMISRVMKASAVGVAVGTLLTLGVQRLLFSAAGITHSVTLAECFASGVIMLSVAVAASILPAVKAARQQPAQALR